VEQEDWRAVYRSGFDDVKADVRGRNEPLPKAFRERVQRVLRYGGVDRVSLGCNCYYRSCSTGLTPP
jgi:hypothetical protein